MPVILSIETSGRCCSAALSAEGMVLCHREDFRGQNHAALLSGFIKDCLDHAETHEMKLDAIAVSMGPGSYTGLRIGLSEAKGLAYALDVPLIGIDTLQLMAATVMFSAEAPDNPDTIFVPMVDARRMEVYTAAYDLSLTALMEPQPLILDADSYADILASGRPVLFFGSGSAKYRQALADGTIVPAVADANAAFVADIEPLAVNMLALADVAYAQGRFLDRAYSVPTYLKDFQATKPKKLF